METSQIARMLIGLGIALVAVGGLLLLGQRLGLGRLPGDILLKRRGFAFYSPLATSVVVSLVLTLLLNLWIRRR